MTRSHFLLLAVSLWACKAHPQAETRAAQSALARASAAATSNPSASANPASPKILWLPDAAAPQGQGPALSSAAAQTAVTPNGEYRVAAIGDSLTDARTHGGKYLSYLAQRCPKSLFDNYGVGGEMVNQMRRRFERDVLSKRVGSRQLPYSHVIVFGGVNDLYSDLTAKRSNDRIQRDLLAMYDAAHAASITVIALTVAPWAGFTRHYNERRGQNTVALNQWIASSLTGKQVDHVIDAYALLSCGTPTHLCEDYSLPFKDGLHFGPKGHAQLGAALHEQVFKACR